MFLLFDIGGTKTRVAVSDGRRITKSINAFTPKSFKKGIALLKKNALELSGGKKFRAIAGALAGSFDRKKDRIIGGGSNIKEWVGKPVKNILERTFGAPVYLENDAALAGLAESLRGAGKGKEIVVYLTWSTGIGGARVVKGKIDYYARGFEPHYQIMDVFGRCRFCKGKHLGAHLSGRAIKMHYGQNPEDIRDKKVWDKLERLFAIVINNTIVYWSPDVIVLGGSLMKSASLDRIRFHLRNIYRNAPILPPPLVKKAKLGDSGALQGALELLKQKLR